MCSTTSGRLRELKNKGNDQLVIPKSCRDRLGMPGAVAYERFQLQSLSDNSNGVSQWWS